MVEPYINIQLQYRTYSEIFGEKVIFFVGQTLIKLNKVKGKMIIFSCDKFSTKFPLFY